MIFNIDFVKYSDINYTKDISKNLLFSLDFSVQDSNLETMKSIFFTNDTLEDFNQTLNQIEMIKEILTSLDFSNRFNTFVTLKDLIFANTNMYQEIDFQNKVMTIYDLLFSLSFPIADSNIVKIRNLLFNKDYQPVANTSNQKDLILNFDINFPNYNGINITYLEADANTTKIYAGSKNDIPQMIDYFENVPDKLSFNTIFNICTTTFIYDADLQLNCLDTQISTSIYSLIIQIGYATNPN